MNAFKRLSFFIVATLIIPPVTAQDDLAALAGRSTVIVRGKVLKTNASEEPLVESSNRTAVIKIQQIYAGKEIAGDQTGRNATVILSRPESVKADEETLFFGNIRFLGNTITIVDEGELPTTVSDSPAFKSMQKNFETLSGDKAILLRLKVADLVFRGTVQSVRPLEATAEQAKRAPVRRSEHDPEWQSATVRIATPLSGGETGKTVTIIFAASRDITWFHSPKLKEGQDAIFLARKATKQDEPMLRSVGIPQLSDQAVYLVTEPYDMLPPAQESRVRTLLSRKEGKQ